MPEKKKQFTIGEISKLYNIGSDSIRYYEEKGLIIPKRSESGYRIYYENDIWCMNVIEEMRKLDIPVERIKTYLEDSSRVSSIGFFMEELEHVEEKIAKLEEIRLTIEETIRDLKSVNKMEFEKVEVIEYPERSYFAIYNDFKNEEEMDLLMKKVADMSHHIVRIIGNNRMAAIFEMDTDKYEGVLLLSDEGDRKVPAGKYLTISYKGSWKSREYAQRLIDYANANKIKIDTRFIDRAWIDIHATSLFEERVSRVEVRIIEE